MNLEEANQRVEELAREGVHAEVYPDPETCKGYLVIEKNPRPIEEIREELTFVKSRIEECKKGIRQLEGAIEKYQRSVDELHKEMARHFPEEAE